MNDPLLAITIHPRIKPSQYPEPFASRMDGRLKRALGDYFGISKIGVNLTELSPGCVSALFHNHSKQEEFIYILTGKPILRYGLKELELSPGMCMGFGPSGEAHQLINLSSEIVTYLEIGDRAVGDEVTYPEDDLVASLNEVNKWVFTHRNSTPYSK